MLALEYNETLLLYHAPRSRKNTRRSTTNAYHASNPLHAGMKLAELRQKLLPRVELPVADGVLAALAAEAASGGEEMLLSEADAAAVGAEVVEKANAALAAAGKKAQLKLSAETRDIAGGLILRAGDIEVNCSIDALLSLNREALAAQVAGILF